jgi:hypothetical protein
MVKVDAKAFLQGMMIPSLDASEREVKRLFWRDDMEDYTVMRWVEADGDPNTVLSYVNNEIPAFEGDYVLKVVNPVALACAVHTRFFGMLPRKINAFEIRWWRPTQLTHMEFFLVSNNGVGTRFFAGVRFNAAKRAWEYRSTGNVWHDIPNSAQTIAEESWNTLRLLADFQNYRYHRLLCNELDVDFASLNIPLQSEADVTWGEYGWGLSYVGLRARHEVAGIADYFDDARIYLNEAT